MSKPILALDCDGVIFDWHSGFIAYALGKGFQLNLNSKLDTYDMSSWFTNMTPQQFRQLVVEYNEHHHPSPIQGIKAAINKLSEHFEIVAVSSYSDNAEARLRRTQALTALGISNIYLLDLGESKQETLEKIGAKYFVDDSPQHIQEGLAAGCVVYAPRMPYNYAISGVKYYDNLVEIVDKGEV